MEIPPWFSNDEESPDSNGERSARRAIFGFAILGVILVMLLIPVLQAEILQRRRDALPDGEFDRTALLFASAMLFGQSEGQAMIFVRDEAREDVRVALRILLDRPGPTDRARLQIVSTSCHQADADGCYLGRVVDPSNLSSSSIRFGINQTSNGPRVFWVVIEETIALRTLFEAIGA